MLRVMTPYSLLSTTRFDPFLTTLAFNNDPSGRPSPFFLLSYHIDRLLDAASKHAWQHSLTYHDLKAKCEEAAQQFIQAEGSEACRVFIITIRVFPLLLSNIFVFRSDWSSNTQAI